MIGPSGAYVESSNDAVFAFGMVIIFEEAPAAGISMPIVMLQHNHFAGGPHS